MAKHWTSAQHDLFEESPPSMKLRSAERASPARRSPLPSAASRHPAKADGGAGCHRARLAPLVPTPTLAIVSISNLADTIIVSTAQPRALARSLPAAPLLPIGRGAGPTARASAAVCRDIAFFSMPSDPEGVPVEKQKRSTKRRVLRAEVDVATSRKKSSREYVNNPISQSGAKTLNEWR
jgi:hypothetical protein